MGCKSSTEKDEGPPQDGRTFARMVEWHPVAKKIRRLWDDFEDASSIAQVKVQTEIRLVDDATIDPVTHESVASVGKEFYGYLQERLKRLNWEGEYHYDVSGGADEGFIEVKVDPCIIGTARHRFYHKIVYAAKPPERVN